MELFSCQHIQKLGNPLILTVQQFLIGACLQNPSLIKEHHAAQRYESFMQGVIDKDEYREMKAGYNAEVQRLEQAQALLAQEYEEIRSDKSTRFQWTEVFRQFTDMTQLDRKTVVQMIQSIRILSKTELEITFRYQAEYDKIMRLMQEQKEAV